uniref:FAD-dependent oxidoreductase domain-containing protein 1 n=1 Tax=Chromera velia CCMP2878 TaxID=1169474 RepID=A0A0G4I1B5_9ALVE|eukprot:Cvel_42.t1-p1 / transcript=Cvel_42.t1 / gene=Cvel_42 / organism=Chromera_velia_CCMP2878 / gene_product=FAD-dependent oxidoreductase domain-containing, putative / transcript_product=FAD-dependent oxidoreductase domain-containing, putative / location=Cvel_scaffold5:253133-256257(-) / protein_length=426 / sequence_SO=supercontig / SO=protein_coding / is_pseudo=false
MAAGGKPFADVLIVGGGIMGSCTALFLSRLAPELSHRIKVVDKDLTFARSSTALSAASIRHQFSNPVNVRMSQFGTQFIKNLSFFCDRTAQQEREAAGNRNGDGVVFDGGIGFRETGYLFLATQKGKDVLRENNEVQTACGARISLLDSDRLNSKFPWVRQDPDGDGINSGSFGEEGEGSFDAYLLLQLIKKENMLRGIEYVQDEIMGGKLTENGDAVTGVAFRSSPLEMKSVGTVVNAAGAAGGRVAKFFGVNLPVVPRKRSVYAFSCPSEETVTGCPLTVLPCGTWFRREGKGFICGGSPPEGEEDPDVAPDDFDVHGDHFEERLWPSLAEAVPAFEALKVTHAWAGHYETCLLDHNAVIGRHPRVSNFISVCGFSGHGLQHGPAAGRAVAEEIVLGRQESLSLSCFGFDRVLEGRPLLERGIV